MRARLEEDSETATMMSALRGQNMNDDDRQVDGIDMKVVEGISGELPLTYEPETLASYFRERPGAVARRLAQIASTSGGYLASLAWDALRGELESAEVRRAAELRRLLISLGPFFIKLGQALSIRPDVLSPRAMVELQQLCDKVPSFDSTLAFQTICDELGIDSVYDIFSEITPEPVAAASLGQVYKATLKESKDVVAVKVQRPFVLETVSLDLYLTRQFGKLLRNFPALTDRLDVVALLDEFASRFYDELDYDVECTNGERMRKDMSMLKGVVIPKNYPEFTARRVHVAEWVEGEKLSQSTSSDVLQLVNLGVITYLTQLLDTGFFHADPHPGNMLRTPDGKLVILDFGLVTEITDDQKYGMIEAIAHLIHRDYDLIGQDFVSLDFIPEGTDVDPIVPALTRVFDAALSGGGAKSINFNDLAADLAEITFNFPFRIPPYFALIIRAIGVLEGIALVADRDFAIVDEAWPYISKRLLTDSSPRMQAALRYTVYGKSRRFDVDRLLDMLQALEKFTAVKALANDALVSSPQLPSAAGAITTTQSGDRGALVAPTRSTQVLQQRTQEDETLSSREALRFFFAQDGKLFREFVSDEVVASVDAAARAVATDPRVRATRPAFGARVDRALAKLAPPLDDDDRKSLENIQILYSFLLSSNRGGNSSPTDLVQLLSRNNNNSRNLQQLVPLIREYSAEIRSFAAILAAKLTEKQVGRTFDALVDLIAPTPPPPAGRRLG